MEDFTFANSLSKEDRLGYQKIAKETKDILYKGYYRVNGKKVDLRLSTGVYEYEAVDVYSPNRISEIIKDTDDFMKKQFYPPDEHEIMVCQVEGFEAAKEYFHPLLLNCSNAFYPGGGFSVGLDDGEERLCRASSLYLSLSSQKASQMYLYHDYYKTKLNSDYMVLSPQVAVFRNSHMELIDHPYPVSVLSVACVDYRAPKNHPIKASEVETVMKDRIRKSLMVAARNMYRNLVLGAFGVNYGHSSYQIARYFYQILIEEEYIEMFEHVIFAISSESEKAILNNFTTVFQPVAKLKIHTQRKNYSIGSSQNSYMERDRESKDLNTKEPVMEESRIKEPIRKDFNRIELKEDDRIRITENKKVTLNYIQAHYPFPECNYNYSTQYNIQFSGFAQGILRDGIPLVAELYKKKQQKETVAVIVLPYIEKLHQEKKGLTQLKNFYFSVLCNGMEVSSEGIGDITLQAYLQYLNHMGIINLQKSSIEAYAQVLYDKVGHKVVAIEITVKTTEQVENMISLEFQPYSQKLLEDKKGT